MSDAPGSIISDWCVWTMDPFSLTIIFIQNEVGFVFSSTEAPLAKLEERGVFVAASIMVTITEGYVFATPLEVVFALTVIV